MARTAVALLVSVGIGLAGISQTVSAEERHGLRQGVRATGTMTKSDKDAVFPLDAGKGDFIQGVLDIKGGPVDLDVIDAENRPVRRLIAGGTGSNSFLFIANGGGEMLRLATPGADVSYGLEITRKLAPIEQVPPAKTYLSPAIAAIADKARDGASLDAFWAKIGKAGTPLVEPATDGMRIVTFLYRGAKRNVLILGAPSGDHDAMDHIDATDIWFKTYVLPASTRLSYQLAPDVPDLPGTARERRVAILATAQADPLNHFPWPADATDRFNRSSTLTLEEAPAQQYLAEWAVPKGRLSSFEISSPRLGNKRTITLYRPPGYSAENPDNLLLFVFDGDDYQTKVPVPTILDNMIADKAIPPIVAVLIPNPDRQARTRELPGNPDFIAFMADELLPKVLQQTGMKAKPAHTVVAGSSFGGLAAVTIALARPDVFGNALSMSGSFWWHPESVAAEDGEYVAASVSRLPRAAIRLFLSAGRFEVKGPGPDAGILDANRHLRDVLIAKGYPVHYREYAAGHDYLAWRGIFSDGLIALFGHRRPALQTKKF